MSIIKYARIGDDGKVCSIALDDPSENPNLSSYTWYHTHQWVDFSYSFSEELNKIIPPSIEYLREKIISAIAAHRYNLETNGITLPNGLHVKTDRESQATLSNAIMSMQLGLISTVDWKMTNGWVTLTINDLIGVASLVSTRIQHLFSVEKLKTDYINTASLEELEMIDITIDW
jgi:hypothetical protein